MGTTEAECEGATTGAGIRVGAAGVELMFGIGPVATMGATAATGGAAVGTVAVFDEQRQLLLESAMLLELLLVGCR